MFDQILEMVKDQLAGNQHVAGTIPPEKADAVHKEVAAQIANGVKDQASGPAGLGGLLSSLTSSLGSGNPATSAITGGIIGSLGSKFGLPPAATGAIAAALPGLLQKFAHKTNDPDDNSITPDSIMKSLGMGK